MWLSSSDSISSDIRFSDNISKAFYEHRLYASICLVYFSACALYFEFHDMHEFLQLISDVLTFVKNILVIVAAAIAIFAAKTLFENRPKSSPILFVYKQLRVGACSGENVPRCIIALLGLALIVPTFSTMKASIPDINPFAYDILFERIDRVIHFGYQPWTLLQPILGNEYITWILHRNYYFWFPVIFVTFMWQCADRTNPVLRMQFLLSFILCWIIVGNAFALMFSSVGPIYFERLIPNSGHIYADANMYLQAVNAKHSLYMFEIKELLWQVYLGDADDEYIKGISAMPSMHVAISYLLILFGWRKGKLLGTIYTILGVGILFGSVHLLWHYAIDGYVSILLVTAIWVVSGRIAKSTLPIAKAQ